jgi:hypothetical protein
MIFSAGGLAMGREGLLRRSVKGVPVGFAFAGWSPRSCWDSRIGLLRHGQAV